MDIQSTQLKNLIGMAGLICCLSICCKTFAQDEVDKADDETETAEADEHDHEHDHQHEQPTLEELVVTAHPLSEGEISGSYARISAEDIAKMTQSSIGETVSSQPGVHSASFGKAVGRPVIHGLGGVRVQVLEDQIHSMDASGSSVDHPVTTEAAIAEQVEILRGSSTLLYGSGAIGGIVNVKTRRIPDLIPEELEWKLDLRTADNGNLNSGVFAIDGANGDLVWHADFFSRQADPYDIPGHLESAALRAQEEHEEEEHEGDHEEEEHHEDEEHASEGTVPSSELDSNGGSIGFSFFGDRGYTGLSVSAFNSISGLPAHGELHGEEGHHDEEEAGDHEEEGDHDDEHEDEHSNPFTDAEQIRIDIAGHYHDVLTEDSLTDIRLSFNNYEHQETEGGHIGTAVDIESVEARAMIKFPHARGSVDVFGIQYSSRDFASTGEEAYLAPVMSSSYAAFFLRERSYSAFDLELGGRLERTHHEPESGRNASFTTYAMSGGAVLPIQDNLSLGLLVDYSVRAPVAEELYSDGGHLATARYEVGQPDLDEESCFCLSATVLTTGSRRWSSSTTVYRSQFNDFIVPLLTGEEHDGLPEAVYAQHDAVLTGLDWELSYVLAELPHGTTTITGAFDLVDTDIDAPNEEHLPLTPPTRLGVEIQSTWHNIEYSLAYTTVSEQKDVTSNELPTESYSDVDGYVRYRTETALGTLDVFLVGSNLTDEEQRNHVSFVKDLVPLPGRTIELGFRLTH